MKQLSVRRVIVALSIVFFLVSRVGAVKQRQTKLRRKTPRKAALSKRHVGKTRKVVSRKIRKKSLAQAQSAKRLKKRRTGQSSAFAHAPKFAWPLQKKSFWISCFYGRKQRKRLHKGIDLAAHRGTPVRASASGRIKDVGLRGGYGKMVLIDHNRTFTTRYAHLDRILVKPGVRVKQGQMIGRVGKSGYVRGKNGEHLHFEILYDKRPINPMTFLRR